MTGAVWPHGQDRWNAYAAELAARVARIQIHVEPTWLYALCTSCGWDSERTPDQTPFFRNQVATHYCTQQQQPTEIPAGDGDDPRPQLW